MHKESFPGNCRAYVYTGIYDAKTEKDAIEIDKQCGPDKEKLLTMFTVRDIKPECFAKLQELGWEDVISYRGAYHHYEGGYPMTMMVKAVPWEE